MQEKFLLEQKSLLSILSPMQAIVSKRTSLDLTSSIMFQVSHKEIVLKGTDLELSLQASCNLLESSLDGIRSFLVSGKKIFDVVKEMDGEINISLSNHQISFQSGGVKLSLNIKDADEFPPFPEKIENFMSLDAQKFISMLDKVAFLVPQNNPNPSLNGLLLELNTDSITMTSTDGHCLAQVKTNKMGSLKQNSWLVPKRAIFELKKILDTCKDSTIFLGTCGNQLVFSGEGFNLFTRTLADQFPDYKKILARDNFSTAKVDKLSLLKTLRRSSCLLSGQFISTLFSFKANHLRVSINNTEVGNLDEKINLIANNLGVLDIRFYAPYLLNGIQVFQEEQLAFFLKNNTSPVIFESNLEDYTFTYLVMPVSSNL